MSKRYFSYFKRASPIKLGRWSPGGDKGTIDLKVDLANHDSCGGPVCGNVLPKGKQPEQKEKVDLEEDMLRFYTVGSFHLYVPKE